MKKIISTLLESDGSLSFNAKNLKFNQLLKKLLGLTKNSNITNGTLFFVLLLFSSCNTVKKNDSNIDPVANKVDSLISKADMFEDLDSMKYYSFMALKLATKSDILIGKANALGELGKANFYAGNLDSANFYFNSALDLLKDSDKYRPVFRIFNNQILFGLFYIYDTSFVSKYKNKLQEMDFLIKSVSDSADKFHILGTFEFLANNPEKELSFYKEAERLYSNGSDTLGLIMLYSNWSYSLLVKQNSIYQNELMDVLEKSIELGSKMRPVDLAFLQHKLGNMYFLKKNFSAAIDYYRSAELIYKSVGLTISLSGVYSDLGDVYLEINKLDSSMIYFNKAISTSPEISFSVLFNKGRLFNNLQSIDSARFYLDSALKYALSNKKDDFAYKVLMALAQLEIKLGHFEKAERYFNMASSYNLLAKTDFDNAAFLRVKADLNGFKKNYKDQALALKGVLRINDSLNLIEKQNSLAERLYLNEKEISKRDKQIMAGNIAILENTNRSNLTIIQILGVSMFVILTLLFFIIIYTRKIRKLNLTLALRHAEIEQQRTEILFLLKAIHHNVSNNVGIIYNYLELTKYDAKSTEAKKVIEDLRTKVLTVMNLHKMLFKEGNFEKINVEKFISEISTSLFIIYSNKTRFLNIEINIDRDLYVKERYSVYLGQIVSEIIVNSIKYAFLPEDHGKIFIRLNKDENNEYVFMAFDNGSISDSNAINNVQNIKVGNNFGLKVIKSSVSSIMGEFLEDPETNFTYKIKLPSSIFQK